ncbi:MAG: hypothetical protein AAF391_08695 [Bacteroidota bacterium]
MRNRADELVDQLLTYPMVSRSEFNSLVAAKASDLNELERAQRFFTIIMASWGGEWEKARFQTSINDNGGGNRLFGALRALRQRMYPVQRRLSQVIIEKLDWRDCISKYAHTQSVLYLDPPYPENGCNYLHNMRSMSEHKELAEQLQGLECKWILTSYNRDDIKELFPDCYIYPVEFASGMDGNGRLNKEIIVTNYDVHRTKEMYDEVERVSGINSISIEDVVDVQIDGKQVKSKIHSFRDGKVIAKHKRQFVEIEPSAIQLRKKAPSPPNPNNHKYLRKEIASSLDGAILDAILQLEREGIVSDPVKIINRLIEDGLKSYRPVA